MSTTTLTGMGVFAIDSVFVTLILGTIAVIVTRSIDDRRAIRELRKALAARMMEVVYPLFCKLEANFDSEKYREPDKAPPLAEIDHVYEKFRVDAAVVQTMLETYFLCDREKHTAHVTGADKMSGSVYHHNVCDGRQPWTYWHSVRDLLIVDYYNATGSPARYADAVIDLETHTGLKPKYLAEHVDSLEKHNVIKASFEVQLMESIRSVVREKPRKVTDPH
jgi:hypothetical protein